MQIALRDYFRTIATTAILTSLFWLVVGAVIYMRCLDSPSSAATLEGRSLVIPVQGVRPGQLVDTWGQSRQGGARAHEAIDIMAPRGTPVLAAADGTVEKLFVSVQGGIAIYARSADRQTIYYYAHLDRYADGLVERQRVRAGQVIGYVGSTGNASPSAPHLHFAVNLARPDEGWWKGRAINPYPLLNR